jgi:hypothetical protein
MHGDFLVMAEGSKQRSRFDQVGRDQRLPQAASVISSWKGRSKSVVEDSARSTWRSPSTARRVVIPWR